MSCNVTEITAGYLSGVKVYFETTQGQVPNPLTGYNVSFKDVTGGGGVRGFTENTSMNSTRKENEQTLGFENLQMSMTCQVDIYNSFWVLKALLGSYEKQGILKSDLGLTVENFNTIDDGSFTISINGVSNLIGSLDFTTATTMEDVANVIQTGLRAIGTGGFTNAICVWDNTHYSNERLVIRSGTFSSSSAVSLVTAGTSGTDISATLKMNSGNGIVMINRLFSIKDNGTSCLGMVQELQHQKFLVKGLKLNQLTINFDSASEDDLDFALDFIGITSEPINTTPITTEINYAIGSPVKSLNTRVIAYDDNDNIVSKGAIKSGQLVINNQADPIRKLNGDYRAFGVVEKKCKLSGNITSFFKQVAGSFIELALLDKKTKIDFSTKQKENEINFKLKDVKFSKKDPDITNTPAIEYQIDMSLTTIEIEHISAITTDI